MGCFRPSTSLTVAHRCLPEARESLKLCDYLDGAWRSGACLLRRFAGRNGSMCFEILRYFSGAYGFCFHVACLSSH